MPRPGGEADKLGNRYESLWAVDAVLDLIDGEYVDLVFEPVGDEAAGIEFFRTNRSGAREYHSIKRQQGDGNWTIGRLTQKMDPDARNILGDLIQKIQEGAEGTFSSGTSASELEELTDRAFATESLEEFQQRISGSGRLSGRFHDSLVPICGGEGAAYAALRRLRVRTKNEPELTKDVERRVRSMFRMGTGEPIDAKTVRLSIADFVTQKLGARLTADSFLEYLDDSGVLPSQLAGDSTARQRMQQLNRLYLSEVNRLLINRVEINRQESAAAYAALLENGKSVMLEGMAGGGKSCVLAQVITQLAARNVPSLVIRLDRLTGDDQSAQAIGTRRELPDSPTITLGGFAGDRPSVLCIDQLDALSFVSARQQSAWGAFNELLDEARDYPNMRILFACRSFDLEQDAQLRALVADENRVERIRVGELDNDTIQSAIMASGVVAAPLSQEQLRVLSVPLHLYLFLEASRSGGVGFTGRGDLFDAFWKHKARAVDDLTGQSSAWNQAIATLCEALSERESLVAPDYVMDDHPKVFDAMASEAVVYIQDGYARFFHESFFDYSFARTFLRTNSDLVQWLASDEQHLFRRSQVRQVLAFLRDRDPNRDRYLRTLKGLLEDTRVRFHIKRLVLDWLGALPDPTSAEWVILEGLAQELGPHAWSVVGNSVPWFDVLQDMGRCQSWLTADEEQIDRAVRLLRMPKVLEARSATVAALVDPFRGLSDEWRNRLQLLAQGGYGYASAEFQALVLALIADGTLDNARTEFAVNDDWWSIWYSSSTERPAFTIRVLGAWFDRQIYRAGQFGRDDPFNGSPKLVAYSQSSGHVIEECATRAPREFARELFPRFVSFDRKVPQKWLPAPSTIGRPDEQLRDALARAMIFLAENDPVELDSIMEAESLSETKWMSALVLRAWSANPGFYAKRIVRFLLDNPEQRLNIGYDLAAGGTDIFVAVSRAAVAAASSVCSDESFADLQNTILRFTPDWERENRSIGRTRLALLHALAQKRIGDEARRHIEELERRFPTAPERGAPQPMAREVTVQTVGPPISAEAQRRMSDDHWLSAMAKYTSEWSTGRDGEIVGGSVELSRGLAELVREAPARFALLVDRMDAAHPSTYFEAILNALTSDGNGAGRPGTLEQVCLVLRRIGELRVPVHGGAIARAVGSLSDEVLPDDIVQMLCRVALEDSDPEVDDWQGPDPELAPITQAINSARGTAATALARLLFADRGRWGSLKPTIERLVVDRVLSVRSVAVECLLAILDAHRSDALACFERLAVGADSILGTHYVEVFLHYAMFRDYPAIRPTLLRMLRSSQPAAVRAGARQVVLASLWIDEAHGDEDVVLEIGEEARAGAARIYATNLPDETVGAECEKRLPTLFTDKSEAVRREASRCWIALEPDQIATRGSLIGAFARSMGPDDDVGLLAHRLRDARRPLPAEVCDLAKRAVAAYGSKAASIQFAEAAAAYGLAQVMVRLHEETSDPVLRGRILDAIDSMVRAGFHGVDEQLRQQYDR